LEIFFWEEYQNKNIKEMATCVFKIVDECKVLEGIGELLKERSTNYNPS